MKTLLKGALLSSILLGLAACGGSSGGDTQKTSTQSPNTPPISKAGQDQNIVTGAVVTLTGSSSSDADGDTISYKWSLTSVPAGSAATLSRANTVSPTFKADLDGAYVAQLVVNDGSINSAADTVTIVAATANSAPVANAGVDQNIATGAVVTLTGSSSSDADGDTISYKWSLTSVPAGSAATLSRANTVSPTFKADLDGAYVAQLVVNDGSINSAADTVTTVAATANSAPVANAGDDQNIATGSVVTLTGISSSDADGDTISYKWSLTSVPAGSAATLSRANTVSPTFNADLDGAYVAQLVVNDGSINSAADTVTIVAATANSAPVANAGDDQNIATGSVVTLTGSSSSDADGDTISYKWSLTSVPAGSAATLSRANTISPTFKADLDGAYVAQLVVNDGSINSAADTVTIVAATANSAPVANAGVDQNVTSSTTVYLDGSASSDSDNDGLYYAWTFTSKPSESSAEFDDATVVNPSFIADIEGSYVISLMVNDGTVNSVSDTVKIEVIQPRVKLYGKSGGFFGSTYNEISLPFSTNSNVTASVSGIPAPTTYSLGTFKLQAQGGDFTITNVSASDSGATVNPYFTVISNGYNLPDGVEVEFELVSPFTRGATTNLNFSFEIQETGETFSASYLFRSN